ncbi:MAG TPA: type I restriction endonuclease subunit S [Acinetobacter junii]|nr:type I restriction endonuclease subunit S [Acinetobacter junii]
MSQLPRYESYKDSGVQWLGEIPSHWDVKRMKFVVANVGDKIDAKESDLRYFGLENIESFTGKLLDSVELESEGIGHRFQKDDVLFGKLRPYLAKVFLANEEGLSSTEALVFRSSEVIYPKFLSYYCLSQDFINEVNGTTFGSKMPRASWDDISSFRMAYPSLDEQKIIADFLDKRLAQVDALIAKQETLLEKLAEQRVALISHAVTKGLNPDVEMKESGISWLGKVPTSWYLAKFKYVANISYGVGGEIDRSLMEGINLISLPNVKISGVLDVSEHPYCDEVDDRSVYLKKGDILFNWRNGSSDHLGKTVYFDLDGDWTHVSFLLKLRFNGEKFNSQFFNYLLSGYRYTKFFTSSKAGVNNTFNLNELSNLIAIVPPFDEQTEIVHLLNSEIAKIEKIELTYNRSLEKLKEYRSTLITQVVTGKIDVRNIKVN